MKTDTFVASGSSPQSSPINGLTLPAPSARPTTLAPITVLTALTARVHAAVYPVPSCWQASLILCGIIRAAGIQAEVRTCSVFKDAEMVCPDHCVIEAAGIICDPTAWQFGAVSYLVFEDGRNPSDFTYTNGDPCYAELISHVSDASDDDIRDGIMEQDELDSLRETCKAVSDRLMRALSELSKRNTTGRDEVETRIGKA
jgi:hypothetical protein